MRSRALITRADVCDRGTEPCGNVGRAGSHIVAIVMLDDDVICQVR